MRDPSTAATVERVRAFLGREAAKLYLVVGYDAIDPTCLLIERAAYLHHGTGNGFNNWKAFLRSFYPKDYRDDDTVRLLYGLRGVLQHRSATRHDKAPVGAFLSEDNKVVHLAPLPGDESSRVVRPDALKRDTLSAWHSFDARLEGDDGYASVVASRAQGIVRPVFIDTPYHGVVSGTATPGGASFTDAEWVAPRNEWPAVTPETGD